MLVANRPDRPAAPTEVSAFPLCPLSACLTCRCSCPPTGSYLSVRKLVSDIVWHFALHLVIFHCPNCGINHPQILFLNFHYIIVLCYWCTSSSAWCLFWGAVMTRYVARQVINMLLPLFKWSNVTSSGVLSVLDPAFDKKKTSNLIWTELYHLQNMHL